MFTTTFHGRHNHDKVNCSTPFEKSRRKNLDEGESSLSLVITMTLMIDSVKNPISLNRKNIFLFNKNTLLLTWIFFPFSIFFYYILPVSMQESDFLSVCT